MGACLIITCDRCGAYCETGAHSGRRRYDISVVNDKKYILCQDCATAFSEFMKGHECPAAPGYIRVQVDDSIKDRIARYEEGSSL